MNVGHNRMASSGETFLEELTEHDACLVEVDAYMHGLREKGDDIHVQDMVRITTGGNHMGSLPMVTHDGTLLLNEVKIHKLSGIAIREGIKQIYINPNTSVNGLVLRSFQVQRTNNSIPLLSETDDLLKTKLGDFYTVFDLLLEDGIGRVDIFGDSLLRDGNMVEFMGKYTLKRVTE